MAGGKAVRKCCFHLEKYNASVFLSRTLKGTLFTQLLLAAWSSGIQPSSVPAISHPLLSATSRSQGSSSVTRYPARDARVETARQEIAAAAGVRAGGLGNNHTAGTHPAADASSHAPSSPGLATADGCLRRLLARGPPGVRRECK